MCSPACSALCHGPHKRARRAFPRHAKPLAYLAHGQPATNPTRPLLPLRPLTPPSARSPLWYARTASLFLTHTQSTPSPSLPNQECSPPICQTARAHMPSTTRERQMAHLHSRHDHRSVLASEAVVATTDRSRPLHHALVIASQKGLSMPHVARFVLDHDHTAPRALCTGCRRRRWCS